MIGCFFPSILDKRSFRQAYEHVGEVLPSNLFFCSRWICVAQFCKSSNFMSIKVEELNFVMSSIFSSIYIYSNQYLRSFSWYYLCFVVIYAQVSFLTKGLFMLQYVLDTTFHLSAILFLTQISSLSCCLFNYYCNHVPIDVVLLAGAHIAIKILTITRK